MPNTTDFTGDIPYGKLIELHTEYLNKKRERLTPTTAGNRKDTRSIWFAKADIKAFFEHTLGDDDASGLRVYLCAYKDKIDDTGVPHDERYLKRLTVGFVATKTEGGYEVDHYISEKRDKRSLVVAPPQNHGELCPPAICPPE